MSLSCWMRERRAVSSFFFDRLTLIRRLPPAGWVGEELVLTLVSFSSDCSLVLRCEDEAPGAELYKPWSAALLVSVC